jgi:addiction module HigA family antidote
LTQRKIVSVARIIILVKKISGKNFSAPLTPGKILHEDFMGPMGICMNQLSQGIEVPPNRISEIVNGKRGIPADTALRCERYFEVETQFWPNLQAEYELRKMKRKIGPDIKQRIFPV